LPATVAVVGASRINYDAMRFETEVPVQGAKGR
jgi:hypothetical protein